MYYINPWIFYIIKIIVHVQIACISFLIAGGVVWLIGFLVGPAIIDEITDTEEKEEAYLKVFWKWMKRAPLILLICLGVVVITPSEETIYKMMIASKISTSDVEHVMEKIDKVADSIIDSKEQADGSGD